MASFPGQKSTASLALPSQVQNLSAAAVSTTEIDLTWDALAGLPAITRYNVYRDGVLEAGVLGIPPANSFRDTALVSGVTHSYEVTAVNAVGEGAPSNISSATTPTVVAATKTLNPQQPAGNWIPPGQSAVALNFTTWAPFEAAATVNDIMEVWGPGSALGSPFVYGAAQGQWLFTHDGTALQHLQYRLKAGHYVRVYFPISSTVIFSGTTFLQGLVQLQGRNFIDFNAVDVNGNPAMEIGDPTVWDAAVINAGKTELQKAFPYANGSGLLMLSSKSIKLAGFAFHGAGPTSSSFQANYISHDSQAIDLFNCTMGKHGFNQSVNSYGDCFICQAEWTRIWKCSWAFGSHEILHAEGKYTWFKDCIGDGSWASINAITGGTNDTYAGGNMSPNRIRKWLPPPSVSGPANTVALGTAFGPTLMEDCILKNGGRTNIIQADPLCKMEGVNGIARRVGFCDQDFAAALCAMASSAEPISGFDTSNAIAAGRNQIYNCTLINCTGLSYYDDAELPRLWAAGSFADKTLVHNVGNTYKASVSNGGSFNSTIAPTGAGPIVETSGGVTLTWNLIKAGLTVHQDLWSENDFSGLVFVNLTDPKSPFHFVHFGVNTSGIGNGSYPNVCKGNRIHDNLIDYQGASGFAAGGRACAFFTATGAQTVDITDSTTFPQNVFNNQIYQAKLLNAANRSSGNVATALSGLVLDPNNNAKGLGTMPPRTQVTIGGNNVTSITLGSSRWIWDNGGVGSPWTDGVSQPDFIALVPGSNFAAAQIVQVQTGGANWITGVVLLQSGVTTVAGDNVWPVMPDGVTIMKDYGVMR